MSLDNLLLDLAIGGEWLFLGLVTLMVVEVIEVFNTATNATKVPGLNIPQPPIVKVPLATGVVKQLVKVEQRKLSASQLQKLTKPQLHELCSDRNLKRKSAYSKRELVQYLLQSQV
jgi:hypothetical protein